TLHEPIPQDPRDDMALGVVLDGELPAAIETPSGVVRAPDPRKPAGATDSIYASSGKTDLVGSATYTPDRDTKRPDVLPYDDPFDPSTAPFKRLVAYDIVDANYTLHVRDTHLEPILDHASFAPDGGEEQFFEDLVVDVRPGSRVRIPSVGPGARVVRAHASSGGGSDVGIHLWRDGAENWFVEGMQPSRVRLVMELTIPRAAFGGGFGNPRWTEYPPLQQLPANVAAAVQVVTARIGVSRAQSPREVVRKLVAYYRAFTDSDDPPRGNADIYLDLALSQKGVCRHRAFAFLVTALGLGLPTRMVVNEAHAWVEVHDGTLYRRIDLGGAGRTLGDPKSGKTAHAPPADPFAWPSGATRGTDLADRSNGAAASAAASGAGGTGSGSGAGGTNPRTGTTSGTPATIPSTNMSTTPAPADSKAEKDDRPASKIDLSIADPDARRGGPLHVKGTVVADGDPCSNVVVDVVLREIAHPRHEVRIGSIATDLHGVFVGALILPASVPVGDYEVAAHTQGDLRCGGTAP
ncbi:MAG: transglutaminase-like domain-containing protein, partial [Polyangiaceae bacterium]